MTGSSPLPTGGQAQTMKIDQLISPPLMGEEIFRLFSEQFKETGSLWK
jgi:hypothetical protein